MLPWLLKVTNFTYDVSAVKRFWSITKQMQGLIISANPLFTEVVSHALVRYFSKGYLLLKPEQAAKGLENYSPDVILIDDRMRSDLLYRVMERTRQLKKTQVILINPESNDCIVVRSYLTTITNLEVFMNKIVSEPDHTLVYPDQDESVSYWRDAQNRSEIFHFFASILNQRPDADFVRNLRVISKTAFQQLLEESTQPDLTEGISKMVAFIEETAGQAVADVEQTLAVDWTRLFRGVQAGYGPPPPYESVYRMRKNDPSLFLQGLVHEYASAGAKLENDTNNRPDYLGMELAFISFLAAGEAEAWQKGEREEAQKLAGVGKAFIQKHTAVWLGEFCQAALLEARTDFYRGFLVVLRSVFQE